MCVEKSGVRGHRSSEVPVCMIAHVRARLCVVEPEKLRSRVRFYFFDGLCVTVGQHTCVWQKQGTRGHSSVVWVYTDACLFCLGPFPVIAHACVGAA